ncbi:MAG: class I SAM-dependent rRNA methyltransferase [Candidatus Eremiobacteraeota bacterium]|nr:class I SAM-dependent rRNA methyltransferase [Candidatus Eremiobacteraeota bacterium]MCW5867001.1 class I SAM-dependent rRNA methyltransferase [Candidatus Eremiobacteraeota bacterium]
MKSKRFQPRRYQLKKEGAAVVRQGHPWIFRDKLSSAIEVFEDGQWLQLLDGANETVGWGLYQASGGIGIRVLRKGDNPPGREWYRKLVQKAIAQRRPLCRETEAYRVFNGESDKLPGIVLDVYNGYGVLQTYSKGVDSLGRYLAGLAYAELGLKGLLWKTPSKRKDSEQTVRLLRGRLPTLVRFQEGELKLAADLRSGQKSGTFLDLRGLRRWLAEQPMRGSRVINLFSYTGAIGLACCQGGAREVLNVDAAQASLDFGAKYHNAPAQKWICADIFRWLPELPKNDLYDWIIVDPPSMASQMDQVPQALAVYRRIYRQLLPHLKPGGVIVACCCTSRISPERFEQVVRQALGGAKVWQRLPMELDHKPGFAEANYLKILVFRPPSQRTQPPPSLPHSKAKTLPPGRPRPRKPTR